MRFFEDEHFNYQQACNELLSAVEDASNTYECEWREQARKDIRDVRKRLRDVERVLEDAATLERPIV
jgi:hypothetical protein